MPLSTTLYPPFSTGSTQEDSSRHDCKIVEYDVKNKKKSNMIPVCDFKTICNFVYHKG